MPRYEINWTEIISRSGFIEAKSPKAALILFAREGTSALVDKGVSFCDHGDIQSPVELPFLTTDTGRTYYADDMNIQPADILWWS